MNVSEVMTRNALSVQPRTTVADAARIMLANQVSELPVLDEAGALVGVVTEGDLLRRAEIGTEGSPAGWLKALLQPAAVAADYVATHSRHVSGVMTHSPIFATPEMSLGEVAQIMLRKHIKRLPVIENGKLTGVVSRADLLKALTAKLIETHPEVRTDAEILAYIKAEIAKANWAPKSGLRVSVQDKVVTLDGTIFSDEERQAVVCIAENAPGVEDVHDKMIFVDPGSGLSFPATA